MSHRDDGKRDKQFVPEEQNPQAQNDESAKEDQSKGKGPLSRRDFLKTGMTAGASAAAFAGLGMAAAQPSEAPEEIEWDYDVDVVVAGAGAMGLPAAIRARERGASVLVIDANYDAGGRMLHSGGWVSLGGGDAIQERDRNEETDEFVTADPVVPLGAVEDDPDLLFRDMTDWSVVGTDAVPRYRYNDRALHKGWADNAAPTRQFLMDNYVRFARINGTHWGGGVSRARAATTIQRLASQTDIRRGEVSQRDAGRPDVHASPYTPVVMSDTSARASDDVVGNGAALARPLEYSAREKGVQFMFNRRLEEVVREDPTAGRVLGVRASYTPRFDPDSGERLQSLWRDGNVDERRETVHIRARKAVILGTGGHSGNPHFRGMFYPAMTEPMFVNSGWALLGEHGMDGIGIVAGMRVGANLAGMLQMYQYRRSPHISTRIATRDAYTSMLPGHPTFGFRQSAGVDIGGSGFEHLIAVNQVGHRFFNEVDLPKQATAPNWPGGPSFGTPNSWEEHVPYDWRNSRPEWIRENYDRHSGVDAALAINEGSRHPEWHSGPIWAIFDQDAVDRAEWNLEHPFTADDGYFFKADTLEELAVKVLGNAYQNMPLYRLTETVERWNRFVEEGTDEDFERENMHPIATPPFYAASIMVVQHDSYGGLHINHRAQVLDFEGSPIPGLYAGGEVSGGGQMHGLGRALVHGYIAGTHAVSERDE